MAEKDQIVIRSKGMQLVAGDGMVLTAEDVLATPDLPLGAASPAVIGTTLFAAHADHRHPYPIFAEVAPLVEDVTIPGASTNAGAPGTATKVAHADHQHIKAVASTTEKGEVKLATTVERAAGTSASAVPTIADIATLAVTDAYGINAVGGSANAITLTPSVDHVLVAGMVKTFIAAYTNTSATVTLNFNATGALPLVRNGGLPLVANDLIVGGAFDAVYKGTAWWVLNPITAANTLPTGIDGGTAATVF